MLFEISNFNRVSQHLSAMNCEEISIHREPHNINAKFYAINFIVLKSVACSIAIGGCLKCSFSSSGSFGFCRTFD